MQELISPAQSEKLVLIGALLLALWGAVSGYRVLGTKGLIGIVPGLLVWPLWQMHKYVTRFDPQTGYFGLDKVKVLFGEAALFIVIGVVLGWMWSKISFTAEAQSRGEEIDQNLSTSGRLSGE